MSVSVLFSGRLQEQPAPPSMLASYEAFKDGSLYKKYAAFNPGEASRIDAYWYGGPSVTAATPTGNGLLGWATFYRSL